MNALAKKRVFGFTLIELMIVVGVVAILLAIAYPSYIQYVRKSNRGEAQQLLMNWSINQEIWRSNNPAYNGVTVTTSPDYMIPTNTNKYNYSVAAGTNTYTLTATPQGDQASDEARDGTDCNPLSLNQSGVKGPPACWE